MYIPPERRPLELVNFDYFHPTFLYESLWNLMVFGLLIFLFFRGLRSRPRLRVGTLFLVYMAAHSGRQIWIEGLRSDSLMLGLLPMTQFVSLAGIFFG